MCARGAQVVFLEEQQMVMLRVLFLRRHIQQVDVLLRILPADQKHFRLL